MTGALAVAKDTKGKPLVRACVCCPCILSAAFVLPCASRRPPCSLYPPSFQPGRLASGWEKTGDRQALRPGMCQIGSWSPQMGFGFPLKSHQANPPKTRHLHKWLFLDSGACGLMFYSFLFAAEVLESVGKAKFGLVRSGELSTPVNAWGLGRGPRLKHAL